MSARNDTFELQDIFQRRGIRLSWDEVNTLRRAQITLQGWSEQECGNTNDHCSWSIERDETTGKPYRVIYPHSEGKSRRYAIPDRESGALRRVAAICQAHGLHFYRQTDPRGCALYVDSQPISDSDYNRAVACCAWGAT